MLNPKKITAAELMNRDLVSVHEDTPVEDAIAVLDDYHISGAPVVNDGGECVGIFSASDVLRRDREVDEGEAPRSIDYFNIDPLSDEADEFFSREEYGKEVLGKETVGEWMTTAVSSVSPATTIEDVCRRMETERIHRLLVIEGRKLCGIVSSFDIVRLLAGVKRRERPAKKAVEGR